MTTGRALQLPGVFVSHGAPTLILDDSPTNKFLRALPELVGPVRAVVCVSAHWDTARPTISGAARPGTIYDFHGFPRELYEIRYPAPGDPALAGRIAALLAAAGVEAEIDDARGLDHGAWVPLALMYPRADVPVVQLSVQSALPPMRHLAIGEALAPLREDGVLVLGSGGATHNLREFRGQSLDAPPPDYVRQFDAWLETAARAGRVAELADYRNSAPHAERAHPTAEHFLPLFAPLGYAGRRTPARRLHEAFNYGVLSMSSFGWA